MDLLPIGDIDAHQLYKKMKKKKIVLYVTYNNCDGCFENNLCHAQIFFFLFLFFSHFLSIIAFLWLITSVLFTETYKKDSMGVRKAEFKNNDNVFFFFNHTILHRC